VCDEVGEEEMGAPDDLAEEDAEAQLSTLTSGQR